MSTTTAGFLVMSVKVRVRPASATLKVPAKTELAKKNNFEAKTYY